MLLARKVGGYSSSLSASGSFLGMPFSDHSIGGETGASYVVAFHSVIQVSLDTDWLSMKRFQSLCVLRIVAGTDDRQTL